MDNRIFTNIMVATDGSELARKAVDSAIKLAQINKAKLYAVYVIAPGETKVTQHDPRDTERKKHMKEQLMKQGREATQYAETTGKILNVDVEPVILEGNPADEIVDFAVKNHIDLIVIGTLGKTGIQRFLLGSVAENVVRHSRITVLIVKGNMESGTKIKEGPSRILIATDGSKPAMHAAALGIKFAQQYGAKVYAVYVIDITTYKAILIDEAWATEQYEVCEKEVIEQPLQLRKKQNLQGWKPNP